MKAASVLALLLAGLCACRSQPIKFGPQDLADLGGRLMDRLRNREIAWGPKRPTLALADIRNTTDQPGLNKEPFFDLIETDLSDMNRFDLKDHRDTRALLEEAGIQNSIAFRDEHAVRMGRAVRARFLLWGGVSLLATPASGGEILKQYSLSLKVTDVETHSIVYRDVATTEIRTVR
jgi:hypothetical protein